MRSTATSPVSTSTATSATYAAVFRLLRFNPDGTLAGAQNLTRTLKLEADRNAMTGTISAELVDAANNVVGAPICGVETAVRIG